MSHASEPNICLAILAAGQSRRFGDADKLVQPLEGRMMGLHIPATLAPLDAGSRVVIASSDNHPCADEWRALGYAIAVNENATQGLGTSVATAAEVAMERSADALLICLADMPFVPITHCERMIDTFRSDDSSAVIASDSSTAVSPPAVFGRALFPKLVKLDGSAGARDMLLSATRVAIAPKLLADIDTVQQLCKANANRGNDQL